MVSRILRHGIVSPDRIALVHEGGRVSYGELRARVRKVAGGLAARGVGKGDRVVVLVPMSPELYVVLLAVASIGAIAVFVEPAAGLREMARAIRATRPAAFIGIPRAHVLRLAVDVPLGVVVHGWVPGAIRLADLDGTPPEVTVDPDDPALLTFSSGSTGVPKGATRSHRFLGAQHDALAGLLDARGGDVHMSAFAIVLLSTLVSQGTAVIPPLGKGVDDVDGAALARSVRELGVTVISGSPAFLAPMVRAAGAAELAGVRRVVSGGAPVPVDLCEAAGRVLGDDATFLVVYGSTEAEPIAAIDARTVRDETGAATRAGAGLCVGAPDPHVRLRLLAPTTAPILVGPGGLAAREVPRGEVGEVVVAGPHVNERYYRNPAAERATKIVDEAGVVWHRTGDAAYLDGRGRLWLVGRVADIVRRGEKVYHPSAVEAAARSIPWVERAALVGDGRGGTLLIVEAAAAPRNGDLAALTSHLAGQGVVIDRVEVTDKLPVDPRHRAKIDYPAVRRQYGVSP